MTSGLLARGKNGGGMWGTTFGGGGAYIFPGPARGFISSLGAEAEVGESDVGAPFAGRSLPWLISPAVELVEGADGV